jgi:hypothetical protein
MLRLLERTIDSLDRRLLLLAPSTAIPSVLRHAVVDDRYHRDLLNQMQALRGNVYFADGAVGRAQLAADGRHETAEDEKSWHLLTLDDRMRVTGCAWYLQHEEEVRVRDLRVRHCPLAMLSTWRSRLWKSVESEITQARRECLNYAEVGGWAVSEACRRTSEGLVLALAGYSLGRICGDCLGITTATMRHCSSSILRRLGGAPLSVGGTALPSYYDPRYRCEMEILRFDSRRPSAKYTTLVDAVCERMADVLVVARPEPAFASNAAAESFAPDWTPPAELAYAV